VKFEKGDLINFVGYIKDGVISSLLITKWLIIKSQFSQ
jgi:hypothetical protein